MRGRWPAALALVVCASVTDVGADVLARRPASALLATCEAVSGVPVETVAEARCLAFIEGFVWGHGWAQWRRSSDMYFCLPDNGDVDARALVPAIVAYLRSHPERIDQPAHLMLFAALTSAYPCR